MRVVVGWDQLGSGALLLPVLGGRRSPSDAEPSAEDLSHALLPYAGPCSDLRKRQALLYAQTAYLKVAPILRVV